MDYPDFVDPSYIGASGMPGYPSNPDPSFVGASGMPNYPGGTATAPNGINPSNSFKDLNYASMGVSALSAITTAIGSARAATAQGEIENSIAQTNAAIAGVQSKQTLEAGDIEASRKNLQTQQQVGAERASQGASGTDVASGSNALVRNATTGAGAIDELTIRNNAARQAWGYQVQATQDTFKGQFAQLTAKAQSEQSLLAGGLQAISGPAGIEANYLRWQKYLGGSGGNMPFPNQS
jgi:hypothetical protein